MEPGNFKEIKLIQFSLFPLRGPAGSHGLPKVTQLVSERARPPFRSPVHKNGVGSIVPPIATVYFHYGKIHKASGESSHPCEGSNNIRSWFMSLSAHAGSFSKCPPLSGPSHAYHHRLGWHPSTHSWAIVHAEWQNPYLDNDSPFQMSLGLEQLEREGRRDGELSVETCW